MNKGGLPGLLERDDAIAATEALLRDAGAGRPRALFVLGEAGLGKTSLVEHVVGLAPAVNVSPALARGHPMENSLPFGLLRQPLDQIGGRGLLGEHGTPAAGDRAGSFYRVLRWLQDRTTSPLLIALDDVHWADADSVALLSFLCRRLGSLRLAILGTMRPWPSEASDAAAALAHEGAATIRRLAPLSEQAAAALLADRLGRTLPAAEQRRAFSLCAGNPLLLEQLAVALAQGERIPAASGASRAASGRGLVLARFAGLPAEGMLCAQAAAVLGTSFMPDVAAEVAGLEGREIDIALSSLGQSGLIVQPHAAAADFLHPLFRRALYDDLSGSVRTQLHGRAFTVLHERGMDAEAAQHVVLAQLAGESEAIAVLEQAGRAAQRAGAFAAAVSHLNGAVALAGDEATVELLLAHGEVLLAGGYVDRAKVTYDRLLSRSDCVGAARIQVMWMLGRALVMAGDHERAATVLGDAADLAGPADPRTAVLVLLDAAFSALISQGPRAALAQAERATELASPLGGAILILAEATLGKVLLQAGDPAGIVALEPVAPRRTEGEARSLERDPRIWGLVNSFATGCTMTERFADSDRAFTQLRVLAERASSPEAMAMLANGHGYALMRMGRLPEAQGAIEHAVSLIELAPVVEGFAAVGTAYIQLYTGKLAESARWCERAEVIATQRSEWHALLFLWDTRGHRCLREGDAFRACELYGQLEAMLERTGMGEPCLPPWGRHAIAAYIAAGRREDARRVIAWLEQTRMPCLFPRIAASTGRAQLAELAGDTAAAHEHHRAALALHKRVDMPLEHSETLLAYGGFLRRSGQLPAAGLVLAQSAAVAAAAGANWLADLARAELGGRQPPRGS